jgi:hypothetical protein
MSATSRSDVSLIAIVPESECRIPILMVLPEAADAAGAGAGALEEAADDDAAAVGVGAASSLLQPAGPIWQHAASKMSHFRMTGVFSSCRAIWPYCCFRQLSARCFFRLRQQPQE